MFLEQLNFAGIHVFQLLNPQNGRLQDLATLMYQVIYKNNICTKYVADLFRRSDTKHALRNK